MLDTANNARVKRLELLEDAIDTIAKSSWAGSDRIGELQSALRYRAHHREIFVLFLHPPSNYHGLLPQNVIAWTKML
jgi:hypothetical protein